MRTLRLTAFLILALGSGLQAYGGATLEDLVSIESSEEEYDYGELIFFTITNDTDSILVVGNQPPFCVYAIETDSLIFVGPLPSEYHLDPHSFEQWEWDHEFWLGHSLEPGQYRVQVDYTLGLYGGPGGSVDDTFAVLEDVPVYRATWGEIKALWAD